MRKLVVLDFAGRDVVGTWSPVRSCASYRRAGTAPGMPATVIQFFEMSEEQS